MMKLTQKAYEQGRRFVETNARPLEVARLRFHFDAAPAEAVLAELARFQNPDGGFGQALEPDLRAPESSALATSIAFQVLREVGAHQYDRMVAAAVQYLLRTLDPGLGTWRIVPPSAERSPHAPWWTQTGREEQFNSFSLNPTAELLGYLGEYDQDVPAAVRSSLADKVLAHLEGLGSIEMHDLLCCKRLVETEGLEPAFRGRMLDRLAGLWRGVVSTDRSEWARYSLRPVQMADGPQSPFYEALRDVIDLNLDYEVTTQQEDGSWAPTWSWGESYPEVFEKVKVEWQGVFLLEKFLTLKRYGRIEGMV